MRKGIFFEIKIRKCACYTEKYPSKYYILFESAKKNN